MRPSSRRLGEFALPGLAAAEGGPEIAKTVSDSPGAQEAGVLADHFSGGVAGNIGEVLVDVFDLTLDVGDHHHDGAAVDGAVEFADFLLGDAALVDVLRGAEHTDGAAGGVAGGDLALVDDPAPLAVTGEEAVLAFPAGLFASEAVLETLFHAL